MTATIDTRRELAHRASNGIEVSLFWSKATNHVTIEVFDSRFDDGFAFEVDGSAALDAFHHPYAYAAARGFTSSPMRSKNHTGGSRDVASSHSS